MGKLDGKIAIVTGGTTGIGFEAAQRFRDEGAKVVITGQNQERLEAAAARLGEDVTAIRADSRSLDDLDRLADRVKREFGRVDVLFANAGLGVFAPIESVDEAGYDKQFDINVKGVYFTVQKLLPLLGRGSSILLTSSAVNEKGVPTGSLYFATKAAVRSLARSLGAELGPRGIRVNALSPGVVRTHFSEATNVPAEDFEQFIQMVVAGAPLGREGTVDDIANAALFLASDDSSYMTATDLVVDGGWMNV